MEKLIFGSIILLFVFAGLTIFIKDVITAAKNPSFGKQGSKYYVQNNNPWYGIPRNYHSDSTYDSSSSCDSDSFDGGGDCGGGD